MSSSNYYELYLRDPDASSWVEVTRFEGLEFSNGLNIAPSMEATIYLTDSGNQDLPKADRLFRITAKDGTEVFIGTLDDANGDQKTAVKNNKPVKWNIRGSGLSQASVANVTYQGTTDLSDNAGNVIGSLIDDVNGRSPGTLAKGTIENGPSINVHIREAELLPVFYDIAEIGDSTDNFPYFIVVDHPSSSDFTPQVNYYSPENSRYETTDPFDTDGSGSTDEGRILDERTEIRRLEESSENDRIANAVKVRYSGIGSGSGSSETSEATNSTSINEFGRQEAIPFAPWIQNSSTADIFRDTVLNTYNGVDSSGTAVGIKTFEVVVEDAKFGSWGDSFDAILGDQVGIRMNNGNTFQGRFHKYHYKQMAEELKVTIGIPKLEFSERVTRSVRKTEQAYSSMKITDTSLTTETTQSAAADSDNSTSSLGSFTVADGSSTSNNETVGSVTGDSGFIICLMGVDVGTESGSVSLQIRNTSNNTTLTSASGTIQSGATIMGVQTGSNLEGDNIRFRLTNNTGATLSGNLTSSVGTLSAHTHSVDLSHTHNM